MCHIGVFKWNHVVNKAVYGSDADHAVTRLAGPADLFERHSPEVIKWKWGKWGQRDLVSTGLPPSLPLSHFPPPAPTNSHRG